MDDQGSAKRARLNSALVQKEGRFLIRDVPPSHFKFKIESFSSLSSSSVERYQSCEFDAGDYKWRLAIYPNGNKKGDGKDHISIYLLLDKSHHTNINNKEISVIFNFLVYNQIRDKYLSVQGVSRFHSMKYEAGIDKFLPLMFFEKPSNGYLINNTCMFGVDVFVVKTATKGQCLSMMPVKPVPFKYTWRVKNLTMLEDKCYYSEKFRSGNHDWKIMFYPKGDTKGSGNSISMYLHLADVATSLTRGIEVVVEYKLRIVDQVNEKHKEFGSTACFDHVHQILIGDGVSL